MEVSIGKSPKSMAHVCHVWWLRRVKSPFQNPMNNKPPFYHVPMLFPWFSYMMSPNFSTHRAQTIPRVPREFLPTPGLALYFTGFPVVGRTRTDTARCTTCALVTTHLRRAMLPWRSIYGAFPRMNDCIYISQKIPIYIHYIYIYREREIWCISVIWYMICIRIKDFNIFTIHLPEVYRISTAPPRLPHLPSSRKPVPVDDCWPQMAGIAQIMALRWINKSFLGMIWGWCLFGENILWATWHNFLGKLE